jgi:SAM-dependent methyltransferase
MADKCVEHCEPRRTRAYFFQCLSDFIEWGGQSWERLLRYALSKSGAVEGKKVLEIGFRSGKMTCLFALLGAEVTAIETNASALPIANEEVVRWGVRSRVSLIHYDGNLAHCMALKGRKFDVIFSKSVLVLLRDSLPLYLQGLEELMAPGGRFIFMENAHGGKVFALVRRLRYLWYKDLRPWHIDYFRPFHLKLISQTFAIDEIKRSYFPPIYLIMGHKMHAVSSHCANPDS